MGYNTIFKGELKFTHELTASQLAQLNEILGEACREHPEWKEPELDYVDLVLTDRFDGVRWNDATEKTYHLTEVVNMVIRLMREVDPAFGLTGLLSAQGEDAEDRWTLTMGDDGLAHKLIVPILGQKITCPHCEETFILEEKSK